MKKHFLKAAVVAAMSTAVLAGTAQASGMDNIGVGVGYDVLSGGTLELNYPINDTFSVRGSVSNGIGFSESEQQDGILYKAKADGGIHRLAVNYHPFQGNFFLSAGYAINNFELGVKGTGSGSVTVGDDAFNNATVSMKGDVSWNNAPTLSLGWGHSPKKGWGFMAEVGMIYTGSPDVSLKGTGTYDNGGGAVDVSSDPTFQAALKGEEKKLKDDLADANFLPLLQAGITYRF